MTLSTRFVHRITKSKWHLKSHFYTECNRVCAPANQIRLKFLVFCGLKIVEDKNRGFLDQAKVERLLSYKITQNRAGMQQKEDTVRMNIRFLL